MARWLFDKEISVGINHGPRQPSHQRTGNGLQDKGRMTPWNWFRGHQDCHSHHLPREKIYFYGWGHPSGAGGPGCPCLGVSCLWPHQELQSGLQPVQWNCGIDGALAKSHSVGNTPPNCWESLTPQWVRKAKEHQAKEDYYWILEVSWNLPN